MVISSLTPLILNCCWVFLFPLAPLGSSGNTVPGGWLHQKTPFHPAPVLLALKDPAGSSQKEEPGSPAGNTTTTVKQQPGAPERGEKKVPRQNFVPSEKIKADKAVDFPADI